MVVKEGNKLLTANGTATIIYANIHEPKDILNHPDLSRLIDFIKPVGILIIYIACFLMDIELIHIMLLI